MELSSEGVELERAELEAGGHVALRCLIALEVCASERAYASAPTLGHMLGSRGALQKGR